MMRRAKYGEKIDMGRLGTITRRTFLVASAAIAGGVAFGVYKLNEMPPNPLKPGEDATPLNAFVIINSDGVTIITPKAEMGQGVHSTLAALVAEELDVDWQSINTLHGPPAQAYYNSALFGLALPFFDYKVTDWQEELRTFAGKGAKLLSLQLTGGSTSMRDMYVRMRLAGATARETLKQAAADQLGIAKSELSTKDGMVIAPDGTALPYVTLATAAAQLDPPRVELRAKSEWRYLGQAMPRLDMPGKVTGTAQFAVDTRLPGMKFATVRMNPARSGMRAFDATTAEKMPGVEKIIDLGDGVAVVASNTWLAFQAAEAIDIDWEPATYPATTEAIFEQITAALEDEPNSQVRSDGDPDTAQGTAVEAEYTVPWLAHATMEPMNATALYTDEKMQMWAGNQAPGSTRDNAAEIVGLPSEQVELTTTYMGGGFGRRGETDYSVLAARVAREMPGVPVNVTWSREEDMRHDWYRPAAIARFRGVVSDGRAVAVDAKVSAPSVVNAAALRMGQEISGADRELVAGIADQPYAIPNYRVRGYIPRVTVPVGYWRSVSASQNAFFNESFIDEMAIAAGADPLSFRLEMAQREHEPSAKVIETVGRMSNWTGQTSDGIGRGVAFSHTFGTPVAQVVEVEQTDQGIRLNKVWIACDPGIALDPGNIEAQMTGGCLFGLSAAVMGEVTFSDGQVEQGNFPDYDALRMNNTPAFEVEILENAPFLGGIGEPGTPPAAPALGNALFDLTGQRLRSLPFYKSLDFII